MTAAGPTMPPSASGPQAPGQTSQMLGPQSGNMGPGSMGPGNIASGNMATGQYPGPPAGHPGQYMPPPAYHQGPLAYLERM